MLFLNATDLDRSREYGQESIIYSLEGSSQFRINARSGERPSPMVPVLLTSARLPTPSPGPAPGPGSPTPFHWKPSFGACRLGVPGFSLKY